MIVYHVVCLDLRQLYYIVKKRVSFSGLFD